MASTQPGQEGSSQGTGVGQVCVRRGRGSSAYHLCDLRQVNSSHLCNGASDGPAVGRIKQCLGSAARSKRSINV